MAYSLVQEAHDFTFPSGSSTVVKAFASPVVAGNLLIVWVTWFVTPETGATSVTVADSLGNTYTQIETVVTGGYGKLSAFYTVSGSSGSNTVTFTGVGGTTQLVAFPAVQVIEFAGNAVSPFDASSAATGTSTAPASAVIAAGTADLVIGMGISTSGRTLLETVGWTNVAGVGVSYSAIYAIETSSGTFTPTFVQSGAAASWGAIAAAFFAPSVATPTFSPVAGSYGPAQSVTVSNTDSGLSGFAMYYTTDGSTPTTASTLYTGAITVSSSLTLKVLAVATGYNNSAIGSAAYVINGTVATPTFSPVAGTYSSAQSVTISSATAGTTIYYTTNGSTPTTGSTLYSGPVAVASSLTLKALAVKTDFVDSAIGTAVYTITSGANVYSVPDSRAVTATTPNSSRNVQDTLIYDVPKVDSRTAGAPVDSRTAGAPVDSRVFPNIPLNSRTPGTFGPGE